MSDAPFPEAEDGQGPADDAAVDDRDAPGGDPLGRPATAADALAEAEAVIEADIVSILAERDEYLDALRRLQADFENFKKRTMKQQTEHLERAAQHLVEKLLPVLDAAELAMAHGGGEPVAQIGQLLFDTLIKDGLDGITPQPGDPFDPTVHEAVVHEPGEEEPHVVEVLRPGYRWKGRLLRPAMVKVRG